MTNKPKLYGLYSPSGEFRGVFNGAWGAWVYAFDHQDDDFCQKYWKKVKAAREAMKRRGWRVAKGTFLPD